MGSPRRATEDHLDQVALTLDILETCEDASHMTDNLELLHYLRHIAERAQRIRWIAIRRMSQHGQPTDR